MNAFMDLVIIKARNQHFVHSPFSFYHRRYSIRDLIPKLWLKEMKNFRYILILIRIFNTKTLNFFIPLELINILLHAVYELFISLDYLILVLGL